MAQSIFFGLKCFSSLYFTSCTLHTTEGHEMAQMKYVLHFSSVLLQTGSSKLRRTWDGLKFWYEMFFFLIFYIIDLTYNWGTWSGAIEIFDIKIFFFLFFYILHQTLRNDMKWHNRYFLVWNGILLLLYILHHAPYIQLRDMKKLALYILEEGCK